MTGQQAKLHLYAFEWLRFQVFHLWTCLGKFKQVWICLEVTGTVLLWSLLWDAMRLTQALFSLVSCCQRSSWLVALCQEGNMLYSWRAQTLSCHPILLWLTTEKTQQDVGPDSAGCAEPLTLPDLALITGKKLPDCPPYGKEPIRSYLAALDRIYW